MDNFLTTLYFEKFKISEREKKLMDNTDWEDSENGRNNNIRNDQSISEVRSQSKLIDKLIDIYIENLKQ